MENRIGLEVSEIKTSIELLSKMAKAYFVFQTKSLGFHWNVIGSHFIELHDLFEDIYKEHHDFLDETAERIRILGTWAPSCVSELSKDAFIKDVREVHNPLKMLELLVIDYEQLIQELRKSLRKLQDTNDEGTKDLFVSHLCSCEKKLWILKSILHRIA